MNNKSTGKTKPEPPKGGGSGDRYVYRDWSDATSSQTDLDAIEREKDLHPDARKLPVKLNAILNNREEFSSIIVWLPHGRSWRILDRDRLTKEVLPLFFQNANFNSFFRLVNAWGFRRIKSGVDSDSYYHEMFLRGMPHLHIRMKRLLSHEKKAPVGSIDESPNFHAMSKLPEIESVLVSSSLCSPSIESDPMTQQNMNQARKHRTYTSNAGQLIQPGDRNIDRNDLHASYLFPFYLSSLEGNSNHKPNTATNTHASTTTGTSELESIASSRKSLILAQHRLRQLQLDRIARMQSSIECYQNQRMPNISEARIHGCDNSGVLLRENSPNCFVSAQRSHYPHSLQYVGAGPGAGPTYLTSLTPNSSNAPMSQLQTVKNNQYLPSQPASLPYIQMQISREGDYGRLSGRLATPAHSSFYPHSAQNNDQDTTRNEAWRQYQRVIAFQSHWRGPPHHGKSHDAPSSSDTPETNDQRRITEKNA